ncbi:hypothetical protein EAH76_01140 [Sphingomonas glacialis]|uniref:Uncharacterized protein n=1 Tax=Sphingomonas glacialis TaxID=658225 RepID=A0A502G2V0_9SPHN|nr:hypothetical protein EAH76_01140 [Sphingomonas glacialis]
MVFWGHPCRGRFGDPDARTPKPLPFRGGVGGGAGSHRDQRLQSRPHPNPSPEGEGLSKVQNLPATSTPYTRGSPRM